jgi:hypothetical protein
MRKEGRIKPTEPVGKEQKEQQKEQSNQADDTYKWTYTKVCKNGRQKEERELDQ